MSYIGLYGLGVMGQSLALNMAGKGYSVSVYNKFDYEKVTVPFLEKKGSALGIEGFSDLGDFIHSLEKPCKVLMMVTAGKVVDSVIEDLLPYMEAGDIIIDCGNSYFKDTIRRESALSQKHIHFFGVGVSGGEKGALEGPSMMPGGNEQAYDKYLKDLFEAMSAKTDTNEACCSYIGPNGAGHYVKMVHNGIEYGDIQIICEAYSYMKNLLKMDNKDIADVFEKWNKGRLNSYLIEITSKILRKKDTETGKDLVDVILDKAGQKGTGKWTSMEALDLGVAAPTIAESVFARCLSAIKEERVEASKHFQKVEPVVSGSLSTNLENLEKAVYASKILSYAQGFALMKEASKTHDWNLRLGDISLLWREGCIIRAQFLGRIKEAFDQDPDLDNLLMDPSFGKDIQDALPGWRQIVSSAVLNGIYMPAILNSLQYFDGYTSENLPANLLQAQRDYFGAHTYQRVDAPREKSFHTVWEE